MKLLVSSPPILRTPTASFYSHQLPPLLLPLTNPPFPPLPSPHPMPCGFYPSLLASSFSLLILHLHILPLLLRPAPPSLPPPSPPSPSSSSALLFLLLTPPSLPSPPPSSYSSSLSSAAIPFHLHPSVAIGVWNRSVRTEWGNWVTLRRKINSPIYSRPRRRFPISARSLSRQGYRPSPRSYITHRTLACYNFCIASPKIDNALFSFSLIYSILN